MAKAFVVRRPGSITLLAPYNADAVAWLKDYVPWRCRSWDQDSKSWTIQGGYQSGVLDGLGAWYEEVEYVYPDPPKPPTPLERLFNPKEYAGQFPYHHRLHVLPSAPLDVIRAAYRALAKSIHPDVTGGSGTRDMQEINRAYERLTDGR